MIWISHSETVFRVAFSLDATQLLGLALSADRLAAAAVSAPLWRLSPKQCFSLHRSGGGGSGGGGGGSGGGDDGGSDSDSQADRRPGTPPCQAQGPGRGRSTTRSRTASRSGRPSGSANTAHWRGRPTTRAPRCGLRHEAGHGATHATTSRCLTAPPSPTTSRRQPYSRTEQRRQRRRRKRWQWQRRRRRRRSPER